jgi:hypothetical protein
MLRGTRGKFVDEKKKSSKTSGIYIVLLSFGF